MLHGSGPRGANCRELRARLPGAFLPWGWMEPLKNPQSAFSFWDAPPFQRVATGFLPRGVPAIHSCAIYKRTERSFEQYSRRPYSHRRLLEYARAGANLFFQSSERWLGFRRIVPIWPMHIFKPIGNLGYLARRCSCAWCMRRRSLATALRRRSGVGRATRLA